MNPEKGGDQGNNKEDLKIEVVEQEASPKVGSAADMQKLLDRLIELKKSSGDPQKGLKALKKEIFCNLSDEEKNQLVLFLVIKFSCVEPS